MQRTPNPVADELTTYFLTGDADQGLSSSWGPISNAAFGGFGSLPDPERMVTDRRFALGRAEGPVTRARAARTALAQLPERDQCVLFAAHGPTPWARIIDAAFGMGMAIKVTKRIGDLAGVALLTDEVRRGWAEAGAEPDKPQRAAWRTAGGWLVALCLARDTGSKARVERVKGEAQRLLAAAEELFRFARGLPEPAPPREVRSRIRAVRHVTEAAPFGLRSAQ